MLDLNLEKILTVKNHELYFKYLSEIYPQFPKTSCHPLIISSHHKSLFEKIVPLCHSILLDLTDKILQGNISSEGLSTFNLIKGHTAGHPRARLAVFRIDTSFDPATETLKILEFNTGDPSGLGWADSMTDAFLDAAPYVAKDFGLSPLKMTSTLAKHLSSLMKDQNSAIAIVAPKNSSVHFDHIALKMQLLNYFQNIHLLTPDQVHLISEKPHTPSRNAIEILIRDAWDEICSPHPYPDLQATLIQNLCICLNSLASNLGDEKLLLSLIKNSEITPNIPGTHQLKNDSRWKPKDKWVLKPSYGYGGHGVVIGNDVDESKWDQAIKKALGDSAHWIIQEYVPAPEMTWQSPDCTIHRNMKVNLSLWGIEGKFAGAFARLSPSNLINVHQGGGFVPVLWAEK